MDLGALLGNVATGGLLGAVGGIAQAGLSMWQEKQKADHETELRKLDQAHDAARWDHDLELAKFESQAKTTLAELDASTKEFLADRTAMQASFDADKRAYASDTVAEKYPTLFAIVDFVRGIIRPWITLYLDFVLTVLCIWVTYEMLHYYPKEASASFPEIFKSLIEAVIFMSTTSTMWWFAARGTMRTMK